MDDGAPRRRPWRGVSVAGAEGGAATDGRTPAIRLEGATRAFGDLLAVDHVTLAVEPGEFFAFLGPNGAGKSTTIKMMTTLLRPSAGCIELNGFDVVRDETAARRQFGIVFQDVTVDTDLTAYENMELHAVLYGLPRVGMSERIGEYLDLVELGDRRDDFVRTFSGGMIRRLEIARGLLHAPAILFLDEPTIGLDAQTRTLLWDYVRRLNAERGTTVFFTTHYIEEAEEVAGRIGLIDHGRMVTVGTAEELERQTQTSTLEEAYLSLTGRSVREERVEGAEQLRERIRGQRR